MKKLQLILVIILLLVLFFSSCGKYYDSPIENYISAKNKAKWSFSKSYLGIYLYKDKLSSLCYIDETNKVLTINYYVNGHSIVQRYEYNVNVGGILLYKYDVSKPDGDPPIDSLYLDYSKRNVFGIFQK